MNVRLTPTQERIMKYLSTGYTIGEIAAEMERTTNTISTHMKRVKEKLQARSTIHAAILWARQCEAADMEYLSWGKPTKWHRPAV